MGIYVETRICGTIADVWEHTQRPDLHERWDARFSTIQYLPRPDLAQPQQFLYATRIGFGLSARGTGETVGKDTTSDRLRTSALTFWSDDPKSLIRVGSGYWQYRQDGGDVRFLTWYDYQTRFGLPGRMFDHLLFQPLMGWATAWSFDRLRLWIERGLDPAIALRQTIAHVLARISIVVLVSGIACMWFRRSATLAGGIAFVVALASLLWPLPNHIPAARRCRRRPPPLRSSLPN